MHVRKNVGGNGNFTMKRCTRRQRLRRTSLTLSARRLPGRAAEEELFAKVPLLSPGKRPVGHDGIAHGRVRLLPSSKQKTKEQNFMKICFSKLNQSGRHRCVGFAFILTAFLGSCVATELRAQVIVVPNTLATNDGNSFGTTPSGGPRSVRSQQIYDASQFGALSEPSLLTQFAWRPDTIPGPSGPRSFTLQIHAATTTRSVAGMSTTFADNLGANNTLVFDGTVNATTGNLPGPGNTRQFDYVFTLTTPFLYDPAAGNLVLDLQLDATGPALQIDFVSGDPTVREVANSSSSTGTSGTSLPFAKPTQFTFEPPPLVTIRASQVEVCWNSKSNLTYQVQYRSDLTTNLWSSLGGCFRSTNSTSCVFDQIVAGQRQRFYRVVLTNCVP